MTFKGRHRPLSGEKLRISYAVGYTLTGLDDAETTTLPSRAESALVGGAAGHAALLRASALIEAYGPRSSEITQLMEVSRQRLEEFSKALASLKMLQEFGYPPGFRLDEVDSPGKRAFS